METPCRCRSPRSTPTTTSRSTSGHEIAGEHFFKSLGDRYKLPWCGLRYMNVYGPRQDYHGAYTAVIHKVLDRIAAGKRPMVYGDGSQSYDFIAVEDVAEPTSWPCRAT